MPPVTRHSARGHASVGPRYGDSPREQGLAALVKAREHRKLEKPDNQMEGGTGEPNASPPPPTPLFMDYEMATQTPSAMLEPQCPNKQLDFKLGKNASIALQARAKKEKEEDKEILEFLNLLDKKLSSMEQKSLPRASSFGKALQTFVHKYFTQPGANANNQGHTADPAPASLPKTYANAIPLAKSDNKTGKQPVEIQHVPTGLAIGPKDVQSTEILLDKKYDIQQVIQGSNAELEQKWAIFVIPGALKQYIGYDGSMVTVSEQAAKEEFKLQTGTMPLKLHWSRKSQEHSPNTDNTATMVLAVPETSASRIPPWIHFFGKNLRIRRKAITPKVQQCARCWDYHNPRSCTRRPKCWLCGAKDHTEEDHKESTQQCANCLRPAPADHAQCPVQPSIKQGILVQVPKTQVAAIRRIESSQQRTPPSKNVEDSNQDKQTDTDASSKNTAVEAVNVAWSPSPHEAALQLAFEQDYHVILIQEPWISTFHARRLSKHHPAFKLFTPIEDWTHKPRTLTYIRKHPQLKAEPVPYGPQPNRDLTAVQVGSGDQQVTLMNLYNAPPGSVDAGEGLKHLLSQTLPTRPCLVAGDFNLHHSSWQTNTINSAGAEHFLQWVDHQGMTLMLESNTPTHDNNTIDLTWANRPLVCLGTHTEPAPGFPVLADHIALSTTVHWHPINNTKPVPPLRMATMQEDIFHPVIHKEATALGELPPAQLDLTPEALDHYTSAITQAITNALEMSTKRAHAHPSGHRWWNEDCQEAVVALRRVSRDPDSPPTEIETTQRTLRCTNGETVHTTSDAKAELLVKTLLQKAACADDIPSDNSDNPEATLPFPTITSGEAYQAIFQAKSSTPGQDEISNAVLKKAWPALGPHISALYKHCAATGWHPTPFQQALLVALPKPGKKDYSSPRSYRLIALLSTLGKGLERLIARRLAWTAIKHKVLHPQQFGALPCRSATDLAAALVHDIEESWARGLSASILTLDFKGAFDAVLSGRLNQ
ncbi:hypothetical protein SI65_00606 [Aspergillus cristatus]|uniref:Reverse transcriptase domain-containing protein n=1 Tax=Aspergillus cristatus TaxID=573508 RepID=A0A1E3BQ59_ASPCR|nr:hypothetical protein SI65_00606 [Aspergillus cristatus]